MEKEENKKKLAYLRASRYNGAFNGIEWYKVDFHREPGKTSLSLICEGDLGHDNGASSIFLDSVFYVGGGFCHSSPPCSVCSRPPHQKHAMDTVFKFDTLRPNDGWVSVSPMKFPRVAPSLVALAGKIFAFGEGDYFAEVYDPIKDSWDLLSAPDSPPDLLGCGVSTPVLADPCQGRILAHFTYNDSLYAYSLNDGSWECIDPHFGGWFYRRAVLVDDVIYCMVDYVEYTLFAYDVVARKWLDPVTGLSDLRVEDPEGGTGDALLYLGNQEFASAIYWLEFPNEPVEGQMVVEFMRFTIHKESGPDGTYKLIAIPGCLDQLTITDGNEVMNYLSQTL